MESTGSMLQECGSPGERALRGARTHRGIRGLTLVLLVLGASVLPATPEAGPAEAGPAEDLMTLSEEYWEFHLRANPVQATSMGDHRYDDKLSDNSPEGIEREVATLEGLLTRVDALDISALSSGDRITHTTLRFQIRSRLGSIGCGFETWVVDPLGGPQVSLFNIQSMQKLTDYESGRMMLARWRAMEPYLKQHMANLRRGLLQNKVSIRQAIERVIEQIDEHEQRPLEEWALLKPAQEPPESWTDEQKAAFLADMTVVVGESIRPALLAYRVMLRNEVLPEARNEDQPGIMHVPGGAACYDMMVLRHTSLELTPQEIHDIGIVEVRRINEEMRELGRGVLDTDDLKEIHRRLREDSALHFETRDQVAEKAEEALRRAEAAMPEWFGIVPEAPCQVVRMEPHEEKHSTIAYYRRPAADGSRPGSYYINTYAPETRPRYEAEALAFHEAVPGHHLQIAIMQELDDLPEFRKHSGVTAYVEGWALYTERLSDEMGLYSGDIDRFGMLSYDSWRACRLVVDTGMHALGWTRQQAIDFMIANTVLAENNIVNEVDRYITWPGQALAYKLGQREIFSLRAEAKERLGDRFDIREFHDTVLGQGAVDLQTLRALVETWIEETAN